MRTIVLSDCHGQPWLITNVLRHAHYHPGDQLVFAGDFLDIGDDPERCLALLQHNNAKILWGNHDLAIRLGRTIFPQSIYMANFLDALREWDKPFDVAIAIDDDVLVTHAGLCSKYDFPGMDVNGIATELNKMPLEDIWHDWSPVWWRPGEIAPYPNITQVIGHTPPGWVQAHYFMSDLSKLYFVDPYTPEGFDKNRYRYAVIEDGKVTIYDSVRKL